jgi:hypothetical protein
VTFRTEITWELRVSSRGVVGKPVRKLALLMTLEMRVNDLVTEVAPLLAVMEGRKVPVPVTTPESTPVEEFKVNPAGMPPANVHVSPGEDPMKV